MKIRLNSWENLIHVTGKTLDGGPWPELDMDSVWDVFGEALDMIHQDGVDSTHAFLLMNNHYHWICNQDYTQDPSCMEWFHELINVGFLHRSPKFLGQVVPQEPSVFKIAHVKQYQATYRYIYQNPIKAGLVSRAEDYPYSTLPYVLGKEGLGFQCMDNMNVIYSPARLLEWINSSGSELLFTH